MCIDVYRNFEGERGTRDTVPISCEAAVEILRSEADNLRTRLSEAESRVSRLEGALRDAEATLCACRRGNSRECEECNCDIHAARRIMLAALEEKQ